MSEHEKEKRRLNGRHDTICFIRINTLENGLLQSYMAVFEPEKKKRIFGKMKQSGYGYQELFHKAIIQVFCKNAMQFYNIVVIYKRSGVVIE